MATSTDLREVFAAARPLIEDWLDVAEQIAALRDLASDKGLDWSQVKALVKAQVQDERAGETKRVQRIIEKAEFASAYADMLGLAKMNENNFSAEELPPHDPETGEVVDEGTQERPSINDEASPEAGPQAEASRSQGTGAGTLADREGRREGEAASAVLPADHALVAQRIEQEASNLSVAGSTPAERSTPAADFQPPAESDDEGIPAFLRKSAEPGPTPTLNPRCERPKGCKFAYHPNQVTCSTCSTAWAIAQRKKAQVAA